MSTTRSLLVLHIHDDTPLGDLARDAMADPYLPPEPDRLLDHLRSRGACTEALAAARQLLETTHDH